MRDAAGVPVGLLAPATSAASPLPIFLLDRERLGDGVVGAPGDDTAFLVFEPPFSFGGGVPNSSLPFLSCVP